MGGGGGRGEAGEGDEEIGRKFFFEVSFDQARSWMGYDERAVGWTVLWR